MRAKQGRFWNEHFGPLWDRMQRRRHVIDIPLNLLTYLRSWALPEKQPIVQPFRKFPAHFKEPESSSSCSQEPSTGSYPEPVRSSPSYPSKIHFNDIPRSKSQVHFTSFRSIIKIISPCARLLVNFCNKIIFYGEELLASRPTPKLGYHPLSAVRDCLFSIFSTTLHIWRPFPLPATWGRAMPWWQGTHLTWIPQN
jgi:hypothetical protein